VTGTSLNRPDHFELPFDFQGDPVMTATLNGVRCERCVLDTGAPITTLVIRKDPGLPLQMVDESHATVSSLQVNGIEFGPLKVRVKHKEFDRPWAFAVYLGTEQMRDYCLTIDYARSVAVFNREPYANKAGRGWSRIELFRGRPRLCFEHLDQSWRFVLDTGSNGNWLFYDAQEALLSVSEVSEAAQEIDTGFGIVNLRRSLTVKKMAFGGVRHREVTFLLTNAEGFGGRGAPEDGIIGTGNVTRFHKGVQIIDFVSMRYFLR
jgi:hypothetical protein